MPAPLVHCLTNAVTSAFVADAVVAAGGRAIMAEDVGEAAALATKAQALVINLGQLTPQRCTVIEASLQQRAKQADLPWVLDPVGVGFFPGRLDFARRLLDYGPSQIRGNASEVWALATGHPGGSGTETTHQDRDWSQVAGRLGTAEVSITQACQTEGRRDLHLRGDQKTWYRGGVPIMGQLPGFGCALSAVAATLGSGGRALDLFGQSGRAVSASGLGGFRAAFLDELARLARRQRAVDCLPLYFVAGPQDCEDLPKTLAAAIAGGITCFQYRPKNLTPEQALGLGRGLRAQCTAAGVTFIANDSVDLALALAADGVHLGQQDAAGQQGLREARQRLGSRALIGLSVSEPAHWQTYAREYADYVGLGPFALTTTKPDARQPLAEQGILRLRKGFDGVPAVAIGGVSQVNAAAALSTGVQGLALVSAISASSDPETTAGHLRALISAHLPA